MQAHSIYTIAVVALIAVFVLSKIVLLRRPHRDHQLLTNKRDAAIYTASKLSPVLAVAFAVAADASGGTSPMNAAVGVVGLLFVAALAAWTVYARLTGQFFGLTHALRAG